ncbi:hypothetical protein EYA88_08875 [Burkholderia pseudomallei]|nr:hypothetical protein EYA88_08875 [Burkholderia pseudomallei]
MASPPPYRVTQRQAPMMTVKRKTTQTTPTAQRLAPVSAASRGGRAIPEAVRHRGRRPQRNRARTKDASHA